MTKRKREQNERAPLGEDFGLGATLARLRGDHHDDEDDGGWTTVGAPKPKRRAQELNGHQPRPESPPTEQEGKDKQEVSPVEPSVRLENPFATAGNGGESVLRSNNAFPTLKQDEAALSSNKDSSPPVRQKSQEENRDKADRKNDRKHERRIERDYPQIEHSHHSRLQNHVKINDLQSLVLYLLADGTSPQWVSVRHRKDIRHVVTLMVPGLDLDMFNGDCPLEANAHFDSPSEIREDKASVTDKSANRPKRLRISPDDYYPASLKPHRLPTPLKPLSDIFSHVWPIQGIVERQGKQYNKVHSPIHTMLTSTIPKTLEERQMKKNPNHKGPTPQNTKHFQNKRTPITTYLATLAEQQENEYVVHPAWYTTAEAKDAAYHRRKAAGQALEDGWVDTNVVSLEDGDMPDNEVEQGSVTAGRQVLAIDCEMCKSEDDISVLTRLSVIDWDGKVLLDKLVKPDVPIKDYLTQYSGITPAMLEDVTTTLVDIQKELLELITAHTILVGHSLNSDLNALKLTHPFLVDSGIVYPHIRGPPYKQSLKWLSQKYLKKEIQKGAKGHNSIEDAVACLDLVKQKCERGPHWGTNETNLESIFKRLSRASRPKSGGQARTGAVVDWGDPTRGHGGQAQVAIGCKSDSEVVQGIDLALKGFAVNKDGATEKIDFVWGRLRELELVRGWWDDARTADVEKIRQEALKRLGRPTSDDEEEEEPTGAELGVVVGSVVDRISQIYDLLPPCTAFMVYSGTGDPREIRRLQAMKQQHQREYQTTKWDQLSVKWTDTEVQALSRACQRARNGIGFVVVK